MVDFTVDQRDMIVELVREKLQNLEVENREQRAILRVRLFGIVDAIFADQPDHRIFQDLATESNIPFRTTVVTNDERGGEAGGARVVSDDEEESESEEEQVNEDQENEDDEDEESYVYSDDDEDDEDEEEQDQEERGLDFDFQAGHVYGSTFVMTGNGRLAVGTGYHQNDDGRPMYRSARGNDWDMNNSPPGACFNCGGDHWRIDCRHATGNTTLA